jgi:hypothetical protein
MWFWIASNHHHQQFNRMHLHLAMRRSMKYVEGKQRSFLLLSVVVSTQTQSSAPHWKLLVNGFSFVFVVKWVHHIAEEP